MVKFIALIKGSFLSDVEPEFLEEKLGVRSPCCDISSKNGEAIAPSPPTAAPS
jgi:hypothetical protein